jgi:hypothetical protein
MFSWSIDVLFRAFSDPTRLRILHLVGRAEIWVGDLVEILEVPQPTAAAPALPARRGARELPQGWQVVLLLVDSGDVAAPRETARVPRELLFPSA